jgi:hypothetical protein
MPSWRTPMRRPGFHSVISIRSVSLSGPILVSHSKTVPTPRRFDVRNRMASASCIHSTWVPMSSMAPHTAFGVASMIVDTRMRLMASS